LLGLCQRRHLDRLDEFARRTVLPAIGEEEILSAMRRRASPLRRINSAPSAMRAGGVSPIGEPLAMLPPTVPMLRTCQPAMRRQ
jgi:hypothetical protein